MTREEAKHILNSLKPTNTKSAFDAYVVGEAVVMAIQALDNEGVLDKIRAEIEEQKKDRCFDDMFEYITGLDDALYILDKYKAESEERNETNN